MFFQTDGASLAAVYSTNKGSRPSRRGEGSTDSVDYRRGYVSRVPVTVVLEEDYTVTGIQRSTDNGEAVFGMPVFAVFLCSVVFER